MALLTFKKMKLIKQIITFQNKFVCLFVLYKNFITHNPVFALTIKKEKTFLGGRRKELC